MLTVDSKQPGLRDKVHLLQFIKLRTYKKTQNNQFSVVLSLCPSRSWTNSSERHLNTPLVVIIGRVKSANGPISPLGRSISRFCSMKRRGIFLLPPGLDASPSQGYPSIKSACTHLYTWAERGTARVKCRGETQAAKSGVKRAIIMTRPHLHEVVLSDLKITQEALTSKHGLSGRFTLSPFIRSLLRMRNHNTI